LLRCEVLPQYSVFPYTTLFRSEFIAVFEETARTQGEIPWLAQGTLYPDVIESVSFRGPAATIKTHHNVGGLPLKMQFKLIEPLRDRKSTRLNSSHEWISYAVFC